MQFSTLDEAEREIAKLKLEIETLQFQVTKRRMNLEEKDQEIKRLTDELQELQNKPPSGGSWMTS